MNSSLRAAIDGFVAKENLPAEYIETVQQWFLPLAETVLQKVSVSQQTLVVGISGCQGSGKSTLANLLVILLKEMLGLKCIQLSIDDFYLTHGERQDLSKTVHPLFATRGVPGTHDVELAMSIIQALKGQGQVNIPRFDKATDDRAAQQQWPQVNAPLDVIILEGWCLGIGQQDASELVEPINELESLEDEEGIWRQQVNATIKQDYHALYALVDFLIMLKAPSFEQVFEWRQQQEDKLIAQQRLLNADSVNDPTPSRVMTPQQLRRFIQHYERITRHGLKTLPEQADIVFELSNDQTILRKV